VDKRYGHLSHISSSDGGSINRSTSELGSEDSPRLAELHLRDETEETAMADAGHDEGMMHWDRMGTVRLKEGTVKGRALSL
jgi:hypothetical protein